MLSEVLRFFIKQYIASFYNTATENQSQINKNIWQVKLSEIPKMLNPEKIYKIFNKGKKSIKRIKTYNFHSKQFVLNGKLKKR